MSFFLLTGNGEIDRDLAEEHQRELLEEAQAWHIAEGDRAALEAENYQTVTEDEDEFVDTRKSNTHVGGASYVGTERVTPRTHDKTAEPPG